MGVIKLFQGLMAVQQVIAKIPDFAVGDTVVDIGGFEYRVVKVSNNCMLTCDKRGVFCQLVGVEQEGSLMFRCYRQFIRKRNKKKGASPNAEEGFAGIIPKKDGREKGRKGIIEGTVWRWGLEKGARELLGRIGGEEVEEAIALLGSGIGENKGDG
jgi:hypothetical protein